MATMILRQVKEYDNHVYTTFIDTQSTPFFVEDIEKGLDYFEKAGGSFLVNDKTGEAIYGEIQYDDILFIIEAMECGEIEYDDSINDDFMRMKRMCELDWKNDKRYCDDFFNIYIL